MCEKVKKKEYYITTAIAYASGKPHIGNTYEIVMADAIARYKRMTGYDVFFQTGTDEHGQKIEEKAQEAKMDPQAYVDQQTAVIKEIWDLMNTSYDKFVRTTDDYHKKQVQKIFEKLYKKGDIYKSEYEGWYCTPCESFWTDAQIVDGKCPDCEREVHKAKEESYFFKMSKYADQLMEHIENNPEFIQPESRKNEMINNFLKPGLQDLCVSRTSFKWGVPVTFDDKHVVYVWIDALSNYITGLGFDCDGNHGELYKKYWPADLHLIGKDIVRFHTIYWPILLLALDISLPKQVFGHPWMLFGEEKISKSRGNVIYADDLVKFFGVDAIRYFVLNEMPFAQDGSITWQLVIERINSDLANIYGNLVNRTVSMVNKYFDGKLTEEREYKPIDEDLMDFALETVKKVDHKMDSLRVADALDAIFELLRRCNKYIDETLPWSLAKDENKKDRLNTVLYNLLEGIRIATVLVEPFMPETARKIYNQINTKQVSYNSILSWGNYEVNNKVTDKPVPLFARIDAEAKLEEIQKYLEAKEPEKMKFKDEITIDDFAKIDIRIGTILNCKKHPKADKLLVLKVKCGSDERQIVSGIAEKYSPEQLIGKKVAFIANLAPIILRGQQSRGMILTAEDESGMLETITVNEVEDGAVVK
ncbi:MAG: methionine--tRNA ligase [Bacillota bacterium]|jgi:methionyl-tRNA synthetase|nr:methionine--tRNA ligase [Bacillota bacterium]NLL26298.1 methionine--tRNA ligase [Erysipelotrichia bacterium]